MEKSEQQELKSRRRSRSIPKKKSRHFWMRSAYFMITALLGFLMGAGCLAVVLCSNNVTVPKGGTTYGYLVAGGCLAAVAGLLISKSYREMRGR